MIVAIGSKNPAKIKPVKKVFSYYYAQVSFIPVDVSSGVSEQPLSEEETYKGSLNRARNAMNAVKDADFAVGIEGGIIPHPGGYQEKSTIIVLNKEGKIGIGTSAGLFLPDSIMAFINKGKNLSDAVDALFGIKNAGRKMGAKGIFTKGKVTRSKAYEHAITLALSRFLHKDLF